MINVGLEHIGLSVSDLKRSLAFYCDVLGMEVIRIIEPGGGGDLGTIVGLDGCQARIAHLRSGNFMLELFEYQKPRGKPIPEERCQADIGYAHIGLRSDDVLEDYEELKGLGVDFISDPVEFRPGVWVVYFYGPDNEVCELRKS